MLIQKYKHLVNSYASYLAGSGIRVCDTVIIF